MEIRYIDKLQIKGIKERKKFLKYRKIVFTLLLVVCIFALLVGIGRMKKARAADRIEREKQEAIEKAAAEKQRQEEERENQIEEVLSTDIYGTQLRGLYQEYPQVERMLLNREEYPDWLVEYFTKHREAVDWVVDYPEYMAKDESEINEIALEAVSLNDYNFRNGIPQYFQWDQTWGYSSYGSGTVAVNGCGPTCLSMVATGLTGDTSYTPKKVADLSMEWGYCQDNMTDWALMTQGASKMGLKAWQITSWTEDAIKSELRVGHPVICSMGPGNFTEQGHFIVLTGVTDDEKIMVNDPNSRINSRKKWDAKTLIDQMKGMWAFSV